MIRKKIFIHLIILNNDDQKRIVFADLKSEPTADEFGRIFSKYLINKLLFYTLSAHNKSNNVEKLQYFIKYFNICK
jgi:hypothetical protein